MKFPKINISCCGVGGNRFQSRRPQSSASQVSSDGSSATDDSNLGSCEEEEAGNGAATTAAPDPIPALGAELQSQQQHLSVNVVADAELEAGQYTHPDEVETLSLADSDSVFEYVDPRVDPATGEVPTGVTTALQQASFAMLSDSDLSGFDLLFDSGNEYILSDDDPFETSIEVEEGGRFYDRSESIYSASGPDVGFYYVKVFSLDTQQFAKGEDYFKVAREEYQALGVDGRDVQFGAAADGSSFSFIVLRSDTVVAKKDLPAFFNA